MSMFEKKSEGFFVLTQKALEERSKPKDTELIKQDMGALLLEQAMDKMKIAELEKSQGDLLMEIAMLKMGGSL